MTRYPKKGKGSRWTIKELESIPQEWAGDHLADGEGLVGEVRTVGSAASIPFRYGFKRRGRKAWFYCGAWPAVDLATIRTRRDEAKRLVAQGIDPRTAKTVQKIQAQLELEELVQKEQERRAGEKTFLDLYDSWIIEGVRRSDGNTELKRIFQKDILPQLGPIPLKALSEADIKGVLRAVIERSANRLAVIIFGAIGQMLSWGEERQPWRRLLIEGNPIKLVDLDILLDDDYDPDNVRTRVLPDAELVELAKIFRRQECEYQHSRDKRKAKRPVAPATQHALWICLSTLARIGSVTKAEKSHVNLEARTWFIPKENMKGRRRQRQDLVIHLSPFSLAHFKAAMALNSSPYVFSDRDGTGPLSSQSVTKQVGDRQTRFKPKERKQLKGRRNDDTLVLGDGANGKWTPHDLRRTGATIMQSQRVDESIIDRCQGHIVHSGKTKIRRHYQLYGFDAEKIQAWECLGRYLERLLPDLAAVPVPIRTNQTARTANQSA